ncbi:MAG: hypothetical protein M8467_17940 [Anaerolineae bacterium]|nr:hypothetical protein [Anaerolineae bacterium]
MYVDLELEHSSNRPRQAAGQRQGVQQDRAAAIFRHRLFLILLVVALLGVLAWQVVGPIL